MNKIVIMEQEDVTTPELAVKHDQLLRSYSELQLANKELKSRNQLLEETILIKEAKEKKYAAIINNFPGALFLAKTDGTVIKVNSTACQMFGYTETEFKEMGNNGLIDQTDREQVRLMEDGSLCERTKGEKTIRKKNGERIHVDVFSFRFADPLSGENRISTVMIDITERKEMEEALRISNERYVHATKATFDAIWDWDIINDHLYWGEGYEKIFGYLVTNKVDNHIHSFDNIHPDDRKPVFDGIDKLIKGTASNWAGEYRYKRINNEYAYVQDRAVIIRDDEGRAVRMIGAMQDITEQKNAQDAIKRSQAKFNSLVNTIDGIVWEADVATFQFTYVSDHAEKLLGYSRKEWLEPGFWANHIYAEDRSWVVDFCKQQTHQKKEHQFEYRMIAKDGRIVWLADFVTVVTGENGPVQLRGVMVDITARKKAEEELKEKNIQLKELSKYLQQVSEEERKYLARQVHDELGQLAAVVKMDIDWLKIKMPDLQEAYVKRIEHASSTTNLLIGTIRKLASELRPGMLDELGLNASLEWKCEKFSKSNKIPCVFESSFDDSSLSTQIKTELFRICQESLANVAQHAVATHVTVHIMEKDNCIQLKIIDNGKGFDNKHTTNTLGLIGMRERCLSVNGTLLIESEIGKGTMICAIMPKTK